MRKAWKSIFILTISFTTYLNCFSIYCFLHRLFFYFNIFWVISSMLCMVFPLSILFSIIINYFSKFSASNECLNDLSDIRCKKKNEERMGKENLYHRISKNMIFHGISNHSLIFSLFIFLSIDLCKTKPKLNDLAIVF